MAVRVESSGPRGAKTYEIRWKNGELYDYTDNRYAATRIAAKARKEEKAFYSPSRIRNPSGRTLTKLQRRVRAAKAATERRVAVALAKYLKQANPAMKTAGAKVQKLKGGVIKITPIKRANRGRR